MAPKPKAGKKDEEEKPDRVRVVVRIRPPIRKDEKFGEGSEALQYDKVKNMLFLLSKADDEKSVDPKQFVFDRVLWKDSTQYDGWEAAGLNVTRPSCRATQAASCATVRPARARRSRWQTTRKVRRAS